MLDTWCEQSPHRYPFTWLATDPGVVFDDEVALALAESFPVTGMVRHDKSASCDPDSKQYKNLSRTLHHPHSCDDAELSDLSDVWEAFLTDLRSVEYCRIVSELLKQPVAEAVELRAVLHTPGDWLSPHTDRADKLFSHIFYFNREWHQDWGGCLEILESEDPCSVVRRIVPRLGASVLMARASNSWHQVGRVPPEIARSRLSLVVHGLHQ